MGIYKIALSGLLLLGGAVDFQGVELRLSERYQVNSTEKVAFSQVQTEKDRCDERPGCDDRRANRGSGRVESDPVPVQAKNDQDDKDHPGGGNRFANRGSGRVESDPVPVEGKNALDDQDHSGGGNRLANRGSGRVESDPTDSLPTTT